MATLWESGYPLITQNTTGTTVEASGAINQSGMLYMVILPSASGEPTAAQIAAGTGDDDVAVAAGLSDSAEVASSGDVVNLTGYGLTSETDYKMYVVASGYDDGLQASGWALAFTTPDITAPSWVNGWPTVSGLHKKTANIDMKLDSTGSGWWVLVEAGATPPNHTQIKAGTDGDGNAAISGYAGPLIANTLNTQLVTGLHYGTHYKVYLTAQDTAGNPTASVASIAFRTTLVPYGARSRYSMNIRSITERRRRMLRGL